ncbi:hypothetical protein [Sphingomonas sp.]|uniref:hypothetical protein n=1 Tax=Sphingomonas sp. TaxID=28214 RepID=UPI003B005940
MGAAEQLERLTHRVGALRPDWGNPERFFENRSEIERGLRQLAKRLERDHG